MSMLQMSLSGAALILIIVLIRALAFHRLSKRFFLLLWNIPLARLLLPVSLSSPFSVYSLPERLPAPDVHTKVHTAVNSAPGILNGMLAGDSTVSAVRTAAHTFNIRIGIWFTGVIVCVLFFTAAYLKCRREFRESLPVHGGYAEEWLRQQKLHRTVVLRQSDKIAMPLTYGVLRPVILLPKSAEQSDTETLRYVLTHEMMHIRRLDALRKLVLTAALCIHWFNPLVWAMTALANRDMELTCDEAVIRLFGTDSRAGYAMALIRMEQRKSGFAPLGSHFSKNAIEERITAIMKRKKNSVAALIAAVGLVIAAVSIFATSARAEISQNKEEPQFAYVATEKRTTVSSGADAHETDYDAWGVDWWTPEEYAAWLEKEKQELQNVIGSQGWTQSTGWFTWTQEMVDETIARYEQTLKEIQGGLKLSKPVSGENEDTMIMYGYDSALQMSVDEEMEVWNYVQGEIRREQERTEDILAPYISFGLTFQVDPASGRLTMYWQGKPVRSLFDPERQIWVANSMGEGGLGAEAIELEAVYENGRLIGLQQGPDRDFELTERPE